MSLRGEASSAVDSKSSKRSSSVVALEARSPKMSKVSAALLPIEEALLLSPRNMSS